MARPTPTTNVIELALQHGASSYRNRSDTAHPSYGFTEQGLLQFAEALLNANSQGSQEEAGNVASLKPVGLFVYSERRPERPGFHFGHTDKQFLESVLSGFIKSEGKYTSEFAYTESEVKRALANAARVAITCESEQKRLAILWGFMPAPAVVAAPTSHFDDPRVQAVYNILCSGEVPPNGEHWEGFIARRIVDALSAPTAPQAQPADALDAQRYRYLREGWTYDYRFKVGDGLDEAIDAAMAAAQEGGAA
ncbi:hypothetical protein HNP33_003080 [Comamonas odontotermitis]|uniref:Uncharacterized protein n=1 Tax=Comamonas odontotermitis TaxID=379895 RepID=A0ABR6RIH8_9BURK|nr:hypothetical protein [Comamonas odontotermitis]MBB6578975.1 hypothetical protein [Comamonas odontotermitis]